MNMAGISRSVRVARRGFTLVELLVVIAIIGILTGLLMPVLGAARASTRRTTCSNNLRQIGIGLRRYHDTHGSFPPGGVEPRTPWNRKGRQLAWSVFILPFVEQQALYDQLDTTKAFDAAENAEAAAHLLPLYVCPSAPRAKELQSGRGPCRYGGIYGERITGPNNPPKGVMLYDRTVSTANIRDGVTHTLIVAEDSEFADGQWINGRNVFDQAYGINQAPENENDIRSEHSGGANGLFCGGSVRFLQESMDLKTIAAICTRAGGERQRGY